MRYSLLVALVALLSAWVAFEDARAELHEKDVPIKNIDSKDLKLTPVDGRIADPKIIANEDELAKTVEDKDSREKIARQVDFKTQKLVYFAWSGSSGDRLSFKTSGTNKVVFHFMPGNTLDLRRHFYLFVVPKDAVCMLQGA
jgi:hypothetical protein